MKKHVKKQITNYMKQGIYKNFEDSSFLVIVSEYDSRR